MKEINYELIADRIRETRLQKGLTQENLADAAGVNQPHINHIENHRSKISLPTLIHVCNAMDVTVDYILRSEYNDPDTPLELEIMKEVHNSTPQIKDYILKIVRALQ